MPDKELTPPSIIIKEFYITSEVQVDNYNPTPLGPPGDFPFFTLKIKAEGKIPDRTGTKPSVVFRTTITRRNYSDFTYCKYHSCRKALPHIDGGGNYSLALRRDGSIWGTGVSIYFELGCINPYSFFG